MLVDISGKTALICGASQGIGEATARQLANQGARCILLARSVEKLTRIANQLPGDHDHRVIAADLSERPLVERIVNDFLEQGPIEILINNTGGPKGGPMSAASEEEFLSGFQNHVLASAQLTRQLLPGMKDKCYGRIINIISTSVKAPIPNLGVSNTIRGAMANWAKTLSMEVAEFDITVNNVLPGFTKTPRLEALLQAAADRQNKELSVVEQEWQARVPARRFAEPYEVAAAVGFLASPAAAYINGINLPVDGGRTPCL